MRILFLSDIHGVPSALEAALAAADTLGYDKIALLGDLLYHGPRNGVLAHGHTHVPELKTLECGMTIFNPGSVSLPKGGSSRSFGYYDGENLRHYVV